MDKERKTDKVYNGEIRKGGARKSLQQFLPSEAPLATLIWSLDGWGCLFAVEDFLLVGEKKILPS